MILQVHAILFPSHRRFVVKNTVAVADVIGHVVCFSPTPSKVTITANLKAIIFDESRMILMVTIIADEISTGCTTFPPPIDPIISLNTLAISM